MGPKYEFTGETIYYEGHLLHRIRRLSDGEIGGWIEKEENLSQEGNCWVDDNATVFDNAHVYDNAYVYDDAKVCSHAKVYGNAKVYNHAWVFNNAKVYDDAEIYMNAEIYGNAEVYGEAKVSSAYIYDHAKIYDTACVINCAKVYDEAEVYGEARVHGAHIYDHANVYGTAYVHCYDGDTEVCGNIKITDGVYSNGKYYEKDSLDKDTTKEVVQDFIYKVDDSNKLTAQTEYDSIEEFFIEPIANDIKLDTLVICTIDTKESLIKLQKVETDNKTEFKFIIDITNKDGDNFIFKSIIKSKEQLNQLIQQTIDMLKQSPQFVKYVDDLESCL